MRQSDLNYALRIRELPVNSKSPSSTKLLNIQTKPNTQIIEISKFGALETPFGMSLLNNFGQPLLSKTFHPSDENKNIDFSSFPNGAYVLGFRDTNRKLFKIIEIVKDK